MILSKHSAENRSFLWHLVGVTFSVFCNSQSGWIDPMGARELKIQKMGGEGEKRLEANTIFVCIPLLQISPLTGPS